MKIKVLVIDDSALIRNILKEIINEQSDMMVVGAAPDPLVAREMIRSLNPDVLTLDIEMPNMNGLSFLRRLMRVRPMPVVMLSSHTQEGSDVAFRALAMGAVSVTLGSGIDPPLRGCGGRVDASQQELFDEMTAFPYGHHDDRADALATAVADLLGRPTPRVWV